MCLAFSKGIHNEREKPLFSIFNQITPFTSSCNVENFYLSGGVVSKFNNEEKCAPHPTQTEKLRKSEDILQRLEGNFSIIGYHSIHILFIMTNRCKLLIYWISDKFRIYSYTCVFCIPIPTFFKTKYFCGSTIILTSIFPYGLPHNFPFSHIGIYYLGD